MEFVVSLLPIWLAKGRPPPMEIACPCLCHRLWSELICQRSPRLLVRPFFFEYFEEHTQCRNKSLNSHTVNFFVGMNVIRPTAMASIHTDPTLAANSAKTAERAKNILSKYKGSINVVRNCEAIFAVATGTTEAVEARLAQVSCSSALPTPLSKIMALESPSCSPNPSFEHYFSKVLA